MSDDRRVVVIGSGPAGAMAAYELVRKGIPVTMLETGEDIQHGTLVRLAGRNLFRRLPPMTKAEGFVVTGDPETNLEYNYALGGLSNQWTGAVPRFCAEDFTAGEQIHEKYRWPVTYSDLAAYYEIAERTMEITADPGDVPSLPAGYCDYRQQVPKDWQSVRQAALKRGQGFTTMPLADGPPYLLLRRGTSFNSYSKLIARACREARVQADHPSPCVEAGMGRAEEEGRGRSLLRPADHGAPPRERAAHLSWRADRSIRPSCCSIRRATITRTGWATAPACSANIFMITRASGGPSTWTPHSRRCHRLPT